MIWLRRLLQTKLLPSRLALSTYHQMPPKFLNVVTTAENKTTDSNNDVQISLDANEVQLFSFLREVVQAFEESRIGASLHKQSIAIEEPLIVRIAGGWVRDKLLNIYSDDIDIAVNHFTGVQFAHLLQEYKEISSHAISMSSMGIVAANPAQSKHLETVCMKLAEIDVDICHLRSQEVYTEDSRYVCEFCSSNINSHLKSN